LEYAKDKIMMGAERRTAVISPETMKMTAFHEAGHALVALLTKGADPIHKATIMPRGRALGMVMQLPEGDQTSMSRQQMLARLDVAMGGRVAEELIFGADNVTSGATSDLAQATRLARAMVTKYGLSTKLGIFLYVDDNGSKGGGSSISPSTQEEIDREVRRLLEESHARAQAVLEGNKKELEIIALGLMEYESLSGSEVVDLINGKKISQLKRSEKPSRQMKSIEVMTVTRAAPGASAGAAEAKPSPASSCRSNSCACYSYHFQRQQC
jgi:ATP-dependent Zn protease